MSEMPSLDSPFDAVQRVRSGERIVVPMGDEPTTLLLALSGRKAELRGVELNLGAPLFPFPFYDEGWEDSFRVSMNYVFPVARQLVHDGAADYIPVLLSRDAKGADEGRTGTRPYDVAMTVVGPPDERGMCSLGAKAWNKRDLIRGARQVIVEVDAAALRTHGDNEIHVRELDVLVEHQPIETPTRDLTPPAEAAAIVELLREIVRDGDAVQIGAGSLTSNLVKFGAFEGRRELGFHSEVMPEGVPTLVESGVINGSRKNFLPGVAVTTAAFVPQHELELMEMNPKFEIHPSRTVLDPTNIAANDNVLAINAALAVDLSGQVAADSIGDRQWSGPGGQPDFAIGAMLSKGGRFVVLLPSTAAGGIVSRIQPMLDTWVTVPRYLSDIVITEHGIASLAGKNMRQRAEELIAVAHPDFRAELRRKVGRSKD
jgi:4-hydroxybutyrate CoA-transferase